MKGMLGGAFGWAPKGGMDPKAGPGGGAGGPADENGPEAAAAPKFGAVDANPNVVGALGAGLGGAAPKAGAAGADPKGAPNCGAPVLGAAGCPNVGAVTLCLVTGAPAKGLPRGLFDAPKGGAPDVVAAENPETAAGWGSLAASPNLKGAGFGLRNAGVETNAPGNIGALGAAGAGALSLAAAGVADNAKGAGDGAGLED